MNLQVTKSLSWGKNSPGARTSVLVGVFQRWCESLQGPSLETSNAEWHWSQTFDVLLTYQKVFTDLIVLAYFSNYSLTTVTNNTTAWFKSSKQSKYSPQKWSMRRHLILTPWICHNSWDLAHYLSPGLKSSWWSDLQVDWSRAPYYKALVWTVEILGVLSATDWLPLVHMSIHPIWRDLAQPCAIDLKIPILSCTQALKPSPFHSNRPVIYSS